MHCPLRCLLEFGKGRLFAPLTGSHQIGAGSLLMSPQAMHTLVVTLSIVL